MCKLIRTLPYRRTAALALVLAAFLAVLSVGQTAAQVIPSRPSPTPTGSGVLTPSRTAGERAADLLPSRPNQTPIATLGALMVAQDDELIIDQILTDKYPRVTARFTMQPVKGRPAPYLEPYDVMIMSNGVWQPVLEAHTVGRVPTTQTGTYETSWISSLADPPG